MVYGYMNRGAHEGYSGVGIYHYNNDKSVIERAGIYSVYGVL